MTNPRARRAGDPISLGAPLTAALSTADGCPDCPNTQPADAAMPTDSGWLIHFTCADCDARWTLEKMDILP